MAGAKKPNAGGKAKDSKPAVDRFESDWDGVPNFKLKPAAPAKKPAAKKPNGKKK